MSVYKKRAQIWPFLTDKSIKINPFIFYLSFVEIMFQICSIERDRRTNLFITLSKTLEKSGIIHNYHCINFKRPPFIMTKDK